MTVLRNPKHEIFAQELAKGRSQREAYQSAGYVTKSDNATDVNASRLLSNAKVANRIHELQAEAAKSTEVTVSRLIAEAERDSQGHSPRGKQVSLPATGGATIAVRFPPAQGEKRCLLSNST
jgi:phage terminase small subunit